MIPVYPFSAAWSLSHIGPMTRTVEDAALMMNACVGVDARDQFSVPSPPIDYVKALKSGIGGLRVAWSADLGFSSLVDPEVKTLCETAARRLREAGCRVEQVAPGWPSPKEAWETVFCGGIGARLMPFIDERRADIDVGLAAIVDETLKWGPSRYVHGWFDRLAWADHPRRLFQKYDLLLTPTIACPPFPVGLDKPADIAGTPLERYDWIPFTYPFNLTGHPAASVPCGFTRDKLPVGLQIVGRRFDDVTVLRASAAFERLMPWAAHRPSVGGADAESPGGASTPSSRRRRLPAD
jgi:aspartyl-tRNA(Asn)/glutamyl-tRNA(Gln) amidotransferase subunit A